MNYCPYCGIELEVSMNFCPECGQRPTGFGSEEKQSTSGSRCYSAVVRVWLGHQTERAKPMVDTADASVFTAVAEE